MTSTAGEISNSEARGLGWVWTLGLLAALLAAIGLLFFATAHSLVSIWMGSDTYAHGFVIAPISLWLVWEKRAGLVGARPRPTLLPVLFTVPVGAVWLVAHLVDVAVVQQYAFVSFLILAVWAMVGTPIARYLAFPLGFLLLAVPVGAGLTNPMMNFTADFTVSALRLTGVPVYRDGTFFSIPSGDWSVVEACSGMRYLLAAATLGVLYAYLTYSKLWKRLLFVAFSIVVPVLANGVRAYMIVMIAHLSDMKLATGIDHYLYGWVFFGIVVTIMFAVGAIWRDPLPEQPPVVAGGDRPGGRAPRGVALAVAGAAALWAGLGLALDRPPRGADRPPHLTAPVPAGDWQAVSDFSPLWDWRPEVAGSDASLMAFYVSPRGPVSIYAGVYRWQRDDAEAVNARNRMALDEGGDWSAKEVTLRRVDLPLGPLQVVQSRLSSKRGEHLLVWSWYRVGATDTANAVQAKLVELKNRLLGGRRDAALIAVAAPYGSDPESGAAILTGLLADMAPAIGAAIDASVDRGSADPASAP